MRKILIIISFVFFIVCSYGQTKNKALATKRIELQFVALSFGDLPHYTFKNITTGKEIEVEFDKNDAGYKKAKTEIDDNCLENNNCSLIGKKYTAIIQYKLMDVYKWNGEVLVKTGRKQKRWVVTTLIKTLNKP
jgi:hypothetical protein